MSKGMELYPRFKEGDPLPIETQISILDSFLERAKEVGSAAVDSLLEARFELQNTVDGTCEECN